MQDASNKKTAYWTNFFTTLLVISALTATGLYAMYRIDVAAIEAKRQHLDRMQNEMTARTIEINLRDLFTDLRLIAANMEVKDFLAGRSPEARPELEKEFISLSAISTVYDQIRLLGNDGRELLRVDYNQGRPEAVPTDQLQDKGDRYYFQEALQLEANQVYVSPFDLNMEHGEIQRPLKPVIRVCMPVTSRGGDRLGFVILNYLGEHILDDIRYANNGAMLLNMDGYWLRSGDDHLDWGFMFEDKKTISFASLYSEAWQKISTADQGQFSTLEGEYTFSTITVAPQRSFTRQSAPRRWKLVSFTSEKTMAAMTNPLIWHYLGIFGAILLLALLAAMTRARHARSRAQGKQRLEHSRKEADQANLAKSDFLARMSHEIRTPMNAIIGLTHLMLKTDLSNKQQDYMDKIAMSANGLLSIINSILDFSKIEAGRLDINQVDFVLDDVFNSLLNMLGQSAEEKGLELHLLVRSTVPNHMIGDPLRLGQVLTNLTSNAIKFTHEGEVVISATLVDRSSSMAIIRFSIQDSGIGIPEDKIAKLTEPFSQADDTITRRFGGTGLGLAISKRLLELMGATLQVESTPNKGSTFSFTLTFALQDKEPGRERRCPEDLHGMRVLVVDDSRMSRIVLNKVLTSFSFEVTAVENAPEALKLVRETDEERPFGLVFTDWSMPGMDGLELVRAIKEDQSLANTPKVIMLTAYGHEEIRSRAERRLVDEFMLKPFNRSILFDTIMNILGGDDYKGPVSISRKRSKGVPPNVPGKVVLVAEDNVINQQVAREILEGAEVRVRMADNGQMALDMLEDQDFDAVLMDIQMPVMDGFQAVKAIRAKQRHADLPIIAMTAHALVGDKEKSILSGMNDHITKPIDPDLLMETLSAWLPPISPEDSPPSAEGPPAPPPDARSKESDPLPDLPGIDTREGVHRVRGNTTLYRKLLKDFARHWRDNHDKLMRLLSAGKHRAARSVVHSLKGVAGNIGAKDLHAVLVDMESTLRQDKPLAPEIMDEFEARRTTVVDGIEAAFPPHQEAQEPERQTLDLDELNALRPELEALKAMLERHDVQARQELEKIKPRLEQSAPGFVSDLETLLARFDFTAARTRVDEMLGRLSARGDKR